MKTFVITALLLVLVVVVASVVFLVVLGNEEEKVSITPSAFASIQDGMTAAQVEDLTGKTPDDDLQFTQGEPSKPAGADCDYYLREGDASDAFRVCFVDGRVVQKVAYSLTG